MQKLKRKHWIKENIIKNIEIKKYESHSIRWIW